jgi:hypothetical protein
VSLPFDNRNATAAITSEESLETGLVPATDGESANTEQVTAAIPAQAPPKFIPPNFERIPPAPIRNGSKWTKRPIQTNGFGASTTNPKHWSSFDDIEQAYDLAVARGYIEMREKRRPVRQVPVGGVGFVFDGQPDEDGLVFAGVDFDSGAFKGEIASLSAKRVESMRSYREASVSGKGLHVILKARPLASGIAHNGIELYTSGRFFTMTGRTGKVDRPIISAPDAFAALAGELLAQKANSSTEGRNRGYLEQVRGYLRRAPVQRTTIIRLFLELPYGNGRTSRQAGLLMLAVKPLRPDPRP